MYAPVLVISHHCFSLLSTFIWNDLGEKIFALRFPSWSMILETTCFSYWSVFLAMIRVLTINVFEILVSLDG